MKRQRSVSASEASTAKKKAKKMTKEEVAVVVVGGEVMDYTAVSAMDVVLTEWEEWCSSSSWLWMVGDEHLCLSTCWCPLCLWDVELMGNHNAYEEDVYNDVVWEDDIWDLKRINHVPN